MPGGFGQATWDQVFAVNIKGYFLCARAVYPHMKQVGGGKILKTQKKNDTVAEDKMCKVT